MERPAEGSEKGDRCITRQPSQRPHKWHLRGLQTVLEIHRQQENRHTRNTTTCDEKQWNCVLTRSEYDAIPYTPEKIAMSDISLTRKGVEQILKKLNASKAKGPDNICPLFMKNVRTTPSNYRPVSLTCILCTILEHIVCSNLMDHLEDNQILNSKQHAFRKGHSCETQLVNVIGDWAASIDERH